MAMPVGTDRRGRESAPTTDPARVSEDTGLPRVSIVIPVLNDADGLARCLASIAANEYPESRLQIIVADNGSIDGSGDVALRAGATVVRFPGLRVAALRNRVAAIASGDVLVFVDADHELSTGWLRSAVDALRQPGVAAVGAPYHPPKHATWVQRFYDSFRCHNRQPSDARWLGSGNLAMWARAFAAAGGFDASLTTCEDVDFCRRLRQNGRLVTDERLHSVHYGDPGTLKQLFVSELWRGRDNLVVSFRAPFSVQDLPSVVIPVVLLASLFAIPIAGVAAVSGLRMPLIAVLCVATAAPAARAIVMVRRLRRYTPLRLAQAFMVACTYDVARALALIVRKAHRRA
jgi:hypothetical protein